jgi:hypothetical protein
MTGLEGFKGINLAEHRDNWQAVVNTVMNFWVS